MSAVVLVARTIAEGRDWKRLRPDLGVTHLASPMTAASVRGATVARVLVAPGVRDRFPDQYHRLLSVLHGQLRLSGNPHELHYLTPTDRECTICHTTQIHGRGFHLVVRAGQPVCVDCDEGLAWVAGFSPEERCDSRDAPFDALVGVLIDFYERHEL